MSGLAGGLGGRLAAAWLAAGGTSVLAGCASEKIDPPVPLDAESSVEHPSELAAAGVGGTTRLRLLIDEAGSVDSVEVAESSGHPGLDSAAVDGARRMEFEPASRAGEPVRAWVDAPVRFRPGGASVDPAGSADSAGPPRDSAAGPPVRESSR